MNAKELRIDNLVFYEGCIHQINPYDVQVLFGGKEPFKSKYEPIPLTVAWLLNFGFEEIEFKDGVFGFKLKSFCYVNSGQIRIVYDMLCYQEEVITLFNDNLNHVHQLQNLYFALTSKELTLND